jgi:hypothetical protein
LFVFYTEEEMNTKEAELVNEEFCAREDTYNMCPGGKGGFAFINAAIRNDSSIIQRRTKSLLANEQWHNRDKTAAIHCLNENRAIATQNSLATWRNKGHGRFAGQQHTPEWKANHSRIMREKSSGPSNSQYGTVWITNGDQNQKIKKEIDSIPEGWFEGRTIKRKTDSQ